MGHTVSKCVETNDRAKKNDVLWQMFRVPLRRAFREDLPSVPVQRVPFVWAFAVDPMQCKKGVLPVEDAPSA